MLQLARHTLRGRRRAMLWFSIGVGLYALLVTGLWPSVSQIDLASLYELLPKPLAEAMGGNSTDGLSSLQSSFYQYLGAEFTIWLPVVMAYFGIWVGAGVVAREYDRRTLDALLVQPLRRSQFLLARFGSVVISAVPVVGLSAIGLLVGVSLWAADVDVRTMSIIFMHLQLLFFTMAASSIGLLMGVVFLDASRAYGIGAAVIVVMFVLKIVAGIADSAQWVDRLSLFGYWTPIKQLSGNAFAWHEAVVLISVTIAATAAALVVFQRRDIAM